MNEPLVSHPLAVALKVAGFNWPTTYYYNKDNEVARGILEGDANKYKTLHSAPTLSHAAQFMRETHGMHVSIRCAGKFYDCEIQDTETGEVLYSSGIANTHDTALTSGLLRACEIVKEKEGKDGTV